MKRRLRIMNEIIGNCEKMNGKEGSVNIVEKALDSIHACFNFFINIFSGKNDGCVPRRRTGGSPPARSGEGSQGVTGRLMYVAHSSDGLEAWLQTDKSGDARLIAEVTFPHAEFNPAPEPTFRPLKVDVEEIKRSPPSVIAAIILKDEEFAREVDRLYRIAMDGCDADLFEKINAAYYRIDLQRCRDVELLEG